VTPLEIGRYFYKIQCFCFTEQLLMPGERKAFPVLFYVDPEIANDPDGRHVNPVGASWMWTLGFGHHEDRTPTHGYEPIRESALQRSVRVGGGSECAGTSLAPRSFFRRSAPCPQ
jgi:Cytochrome c oxidase assembly protein CtaG/Cox11